MTDTPVELIGIDDKTRLEVRNRRFRCIKIVAVQAVVLLALAAAAITYVNWASEAAMAEFLRNGEPTLSAAPQVAQPKQVASGPKQQCEHR